MEKRHNRDEPRCESRQETSYKITKGNDTLDTATTPPDKDTLNTATMARKEREKNGPWEAELSYGGEADLHRHLTACEKNPGHVDFIPVDQFNVEHLRHLPHLTLKKRLVELVKSMLPGYQDKKEKRLVELVEFVKAMSDLTVRVSVKYVSDKRPETVQGKPYPCYKDRGSNLVRVGTGWVYDVRKFINGRMEKEEEERNCDCKECLSSEKPRTNFAHIIIRTAAHVVYDELEAAHTTCDLFFDRGNTPDACSGVVTLSGMKSVYCDPKSDHCYMTYVTHDLDIIDLLDQMVDRFYTLKGKIKIRYKEQDPREDYVPMIIVSHPHGCSKQVSVGSSQIVPSNCPYELLYTTSTCPGTSGARVLSVNNIWYLSCHSGHDAELTMKSGKGINYSVSWY